MHLDQVSHTGMKADGNTESEVNTLDLSVWSGVSRAHWDLYLEVYSLRKSPGGGVSTLIVSRLLLQTNPFQGRDTAFSSRR